MKELVETMHDKLTSLTNNINLNTDMRVEASTETFKTHTTNIHNIMSAIAMEFQQSNYRIHNIMQTLAATSPDTLQANIPRPPNAQYNTMTNTHAGNTNIPQLASLGFNSGYYRNSPSSYHKDISHSHE